MQVHELTPEGQRNVEDLKAEAKSSGLKPGMAEIMGVGALAGHLLTSALVTGGVSASGEVSWETVEADGRRLAKAVAKELGKFFVEQGWIPPGAVK